MTTMSFKTFTFPHNPERITVTTETRIATAHCPEYGPIHQNLGLARRIIRAEGVFYGANAKTQYTALEALMWQATAGNLRIPGMGVVVAFPTALSYTGEGDGTVLRYTAEFTELIASTDREGTRYVDCTEEANRADSGPRKSSRSRIGEKQIGRAGWPKEMECPFGTGIGPTGHAESERYSGRRRSREGGATCRLSCWD